MLETLRYASFAPHLGETSRLDGGAGEVLELALIEAKGLGPEGDDGPDGGPEGEAEDAAMGKAADRPRRPFSLLFRGPAAPRLEQGTFRLEHAALGALDVFLVPMEPDAEGPRYEAVFN